MKHLKIKINSLEFQGEKILENIDFTLNSSDRISIVGCNGAGKTTLLKVLTGEIQNYDGGIENIGNMSLGYLHQIYSDNENRTVFEELESGFEDIKKMEQNIEALEKKMKALTPTLSLEGEGEEQEKLIDKYTILLDQFNNIGGHEYKNKVHGVANGMGILDLLDKKLVEVSGGQRTKIALAKVLLESPDILFLDEPTNFIDMAGVEWLESYLKNKWKGGYVIVSHDREFLDKTCNKTYEIQPKNGITFYHYNYSDYVIEREKVEKKKLENYKREQEFIDKEQKLINRFRAGSRAGWAKSREKALDKMDKLNAPHIQKKPKFFFEFTGEIPEKVLSFKEVFIGREEPLFFINDIVLHAGQRIGIVGENGVGKSTFIKTIIGEINVLDGHYSKGKAVNICYYSQLHEELDNKLTLRDNFIKHGLQYPDQHLIGLIKHYLFEKTDLDKKVSELSGGQRSKLLFAILGQKECNLLILDEPTNHLDYDTRESLEQSLQDFKGVILFISHDRYFVNKVATNIWFINNGELSVSYGNYEDYRFKLEHNIEMDMDLFDEEAELNLVLEEKLGEKEFKRLKNKFGRKKSR